MWKKVALIIKDNLYPLDKLGKALYLKNSKIAATYKYAETFNKNGESEKSISLFDNRNSWKKSGLKLRIFPTWSIQKFYQIFHEGLYRVLVKHFYNNTITGMVSSIYSPNDYWMDVQLYFIDKTKREQKDYNVLLEKYGPYCHYPLQNSYKDGEEIMNGILNLYHEKMRDIFRSVKTKKTVSLDQPENGLNLSVKKDDRTYIIDFFNRLAKIILKEGSVKNRDELKSFYNYISINKPFTKCMKEMKKEGLDISFYRKNEHLLYTKFLGKLVSEMQGKNIELSFEGELLKRAKSILQKGMNIYLSTSELDK